MGAELFELLLVGRLAAVEVAGQQAVDHHVGVAADGRGEVGVVGERQAVVADVVGGVERLGHRPHGHGRNHVLLARALHLGEQLVHFAGYGAAARRLEYAAEAEDERAEAVEFLLARGVVHAEDHRARHAARAHLAPRAELRHAAVGQQHELLDHAVGIGLLLDVDAYGLALFVEQELRLLAVESDGSVAEAARAQRAGQAVERLQLRGIVAAARLDALLRLGVGEAAVGVDHRAAEPLVEDLQVLVEGEHCREAEALLVGPQRAELVREPLGQHGDRAVHQVDRRAACAGLLVDDRVRTHVVRHVGDVHAHLPHSVAEAADRERVVEILRIGRIDREGGHGAEVAAPGELLGVDAAVDGLRSPLHGLLETVGQVVLGQYGVHLGVVVARGAQHLHQFARGVLAAGSPIRDADHHLVAVLHVGTVAARHEDVARHAARVAAHEHGVRRHLGHAHEALAAAPHDAHDLAFVGAAAARAGEHHLHGVAVEGVERVARIDEHVLFAPLDADEDRTGRYGLRRARHAGQVAGREAVLLAPAGFEHPFGHEGLHGLARGAASLLRGAARGRCQVLERELVARVVAEQISYELFAVRAVSRVLLFFSCHDSRNLRARPCMKPMPVSIARSSGAKCAVWVRPAAVPTPRR